MKLHQFIFLLLAFAICRPVAAQQGQYRFTRVNVTDGLSHNQIKTLFKDNSGFLWIGTISGLNRYDGYSFRVFMNDANDPTSLISSDVNKVFEGPDGKIWIHTWSGINVYDPITEKFNRDANAILDSYSVPRGIIQNIHKDSKGNYWFVHSTDGIFKYSPITRRTIAGRHDAQKQSSISVSPVSSLTEDPSGKIWLIHADGVLERVNSESLNVEFSTSKLKEELRDETLDYNLSIDRDGHLWIFVPNNNTGVYYFNPQQQSWRHFDNTSSKPKLNTNIVRGIVQDDKGLIWIATDHGGINLIDKKDFSVRYILENRQDEQSLSQNSINVLYKDRDGIIWAGTFKNGISFYHPNINRFQLQRNQIANSNSLPYNDINAFAEDDKHNLWIGTNGGGLIYYNRATNRYTQYLHDPANPNSLSTNVIVSLFIDRDKKLWIGT
jgi:ligand-binding sensor domain-containing protein